jgi:hypothetical protein
MPELSRFLGISILMYFNDHPPSHFHVRYNEYRAIVTIEELTLTEGRLPGRVLGLVIEWALLHKQELLDNWESMRATGDYRKIAPLV